MTMSESRFHRSLPREFVCAVSTVKPSLYLDNAFLVGDDVFTITMTGEAVDMRQAGSRPPYLRS
jgi:hypothetical protein